MAALKHDILIEEGSTFSYLLTMQNRDDVTNEVVPVNLTGFEAKAAIKASFRSVEPAIAEFEVTIADPLNGKIRMELPASITQSLILDVDKPVGITGSTYEDYVVGYYDLELTKIETGFVTRILRGSVKYSDEITTA